MDYSLCRSDHFQSVLSLDEFLNSKITFIQFFVVRTWSKDNYLPIRASQNRSSSSLSSDSVGSIINEPATGQETVGAWKP